MRLIIPYAPIGEFGLLAYISDRGGTFDLWLYDISNGQNMRLTTGLADRLSVPFWSPNSSRIAFVGKDSVIYVITISTGEITSIDQLEEGGIHTLDWSPDAQDIAYTKGNQIILYNVVTHTARRIDQIGVTDVQWFPSGNEILFQALDENGVSQLFRMRVDTLFKQKVTMNENGPLHSIRLSPNGRYALYTSPGVSISIIYIIDLATLQVFEVGGGPLAKNYYPEWSPDSSSIAYSATAFAELGYYSLVRTVSNRSTNDRTWAVSTCFATPVTWSPDSRKLVYLSGCTEDQYAKDMWYIDQAHPVPIRLLGGVNISSVKWSKTPRRRTFRNLEYKVQFQYPMNWVRQTNERYEGTDGFFQIGAIAGGSNIEEICHNEAFHSLLPYGSQPQIVSTTVQNQEACYIFPSVDQPLDMKDQAALIIRYPIPVVIQGEIYQYFILWASQEHIREIGQSLTFLNNGGKPHHF
jgi:TolB protein